MTPTVDDSSQPIRRGTGRRLHHDRCDTAWDLRTPPLVWTASTPPPDDTMLWKDTRTTPPTARTFHLESGTWMTYP